MSEIKSAKEAKAICDNADPMFNYSGTQIQDIAKWGLDALRTWPEVQELVKTLNKFIGIAKRDCEDEWYGDIAREAITRFREAIGEGK